MGEPIRGLQPVPERDEEAPPSLSFPSSGRSSNSSKSSPGSNNPFSGTLFRLNGYQRMSPVDNNQELSTITQTGSSGFDDLGISANNQDTPGNFSHRNSFARVPVGSKSTPPDTPRSFNNLLSPNPSSIASPPLLSPDSRTPLKLDGGDLASPRRIRSTGSKGSQNDINTTLWDAPDQSGNSLYDERMSVRSGVARNNAPPALNSSVQSTPGELDSRTDVPDDEFDDETFNKKFGSAPSGCASRQDIHEKRTSWLSMTIFVLSVYSTVMSGLWLVVAIMQPRWGHKIASNRPMTPSNGTLVAALIAKTIEMSFVTVFISCLGQVLTRRAIIRKAGGMTLAEMTMRNWVIQPGSLITHFETLPYAAVTLLGALSLTATVAAAFYTTASDAMVSPKLKYGSWEHRELTGYIKSSYANAKYVRETCPSLLDFSDKDSDFSCMDVQFAGQSYRNLIGFLTTWTDINQNGTSRETNLAHRPPGTTLLYDNTTLISSWIETEHSNVTAHFEEHGRIINNVTLAVPHPGVYAAATNQKNGILQPEDLAGVGEYSIRAGVVSPTVNVLCVNMAKGELAPLVYTEWPDALNNDTVVVGQKRGWQGWETEVPGPIVNGKPYWGNRTVVDDIFKWGPKYERRPPVFQLYPWEYELLTNATVYESNSIYIMGKRENAFSNYTLCQLQSWVSPKCSTHFNISGTAGASMKAHCEDPEDRDSYLRSFDGNPGWPGPDKDWKWLAQQWALSMDLNGGAANRNASNARMITQLALKEPRLPPSLPSMAEGLAVFAAALEVISAVDTPFHHSWDYEIDGNILGGVGDEQKFNASLITQEYTSGHIQAWQNIFYVVLFIVFAINLCCLSYFIMRSGLVTDFTEPQNLFALAINSPPSAQLNGSCGAGPEKRDLVVPWRVAYAKRANHYFFEEANERPWRGKYKSEAVTTAREYGEERGSSYKRLSMSKGWL